METGAGQHARGGLGETILPNGFVDEHLVAVEGLPQPRWKETHIWIRANVPTRANEAWWEFVSGWLERLSRSLGAGYTVTPSDSFLLLTGERVQRPRDLLGFVEKSFEHIKAAIPKTPEPPVLGPRVVLVIEDMEQYYSYVSAYYREGEHIASGGVQLRRWYRHIVVNGAGPYLRQTLLHELVHLRLSDFKPPHWLEEGLAQVLPHMLLGRGQFLPDPDRLSRQHRYWNDRNIQAFWSGESFNWVENGSELSYQLAEILVRNMLTDFPAAFRHFVQAAHEADGGAAAAIEKLGRPLGAIAAQFLGKGNWEPKPETEDDSEPD